MMTVNKAFHITAIITLLAFTGASKPTKKAQAPKTSNNPAPAIIVPKAELLHDSNAPEAAAPTPRVLRMVVTAYCPCTKCCGENAQGLTASGQSIAYNNSHFVAADIKKLPFGTKLMIPGYDNTPVEVLDKGGAIKGNRLDVFFPTHQQALEWGRQTLDVIVLE